MTQFIADALEKLMIPLIGFTVIFATVSAVVALGFFLISLWLDRISKK